MTEQQDKESDQTEQLPEIPNFAERIYYKPAKPIKVSKDSNKWNEGIWLGFIDNTNEHLIGTSKGTIKCRAIWRFDESDQFKGELIDSMT